MLNEIKWRYEARQTDGEADRGDLVQNALIIAGFAIAAIVFVGWVGTAIMNKSADAANCIESSNTYNNAGDSTRECEKSVTDSGNNSFKDDDSYKGRYN